MGSGRRESMPCRLQHIVRGPHSGCRVRRQRCASTYATLFIARIQFSFDLCTLWVRIHTAARSSPEFKFQLSQIVSNAIDNI